MGGIIFQKTASARQLAGQTQTGKKPWRQRAGKRPASRMLAAASSLCYCDAGPDAQNEKLLALWAKHSPANYLPFPFGLTSPSSFIKIFLHPLLRRAHPNVGTMEPVSSAREAGSHFAKKQMLPHALPAARAFFAHYPIIIR